MNQTSKFETNNSPHLNKIQRFFHFIRRHWVIVIIIGVIIIVGIIFITSYIMKLGTEKKPLGGSQRPQPVTALITNKTDFDVYLKGLGTVIPTNTVTMYAFKRDSMSTKVT
jgi:multidrug efflux pump subunit AcrA (membrane-fusion protein)